MTPVMEHGHFRDNLVYKPAFVLSQQSAYAVALGCAQKSGVVLTRPDKISEICARAPMLSRFDDAHGRSIALAALHHNEMLLSLRSEAGHPRKHC
jgi:hypothetical protein